MDWYQLTQEASDKFVEHEFARLDRMRDDLIKRNDQLRAERGEEKLYGFIFDGIKYRMTRPPTFHDYLPGAEFELDAEIVCYVNDARKVSDDRTKIRQLATLLLLPVDTYQDARNALPDEIAECHPKLASLSRTKEMEYYQFSEKTKRYLEELSSLISFYSATRLVY